ncbi:hypothetical protein LCGC14_0082670 [marine sediment metagenome]|uniref:Uncharacterized protein n=1 Tax=marine sediment metagenome TaxID=412755 RepID=A0A0F9VLM3_9ZZZZ
MGILKEILKGKVIARAIGKYKLGSRLTMVFILWLSGFVAG